MSTISSNKFNLNKIDQNSGHWIFEISYKSMKKKYQNLVCICTDYIGHILIRRSTFI